MSQTKTWNIDFKSHGITVHIEMTVHIFRICPHFLGFPILVYPICTVLMTVMIVCRTIMTFRAPRHTLCFGHRFPRQVKMLVAEPQFPAKSQGARVALAKGFDLDNSHQVHRP